jgi:hypothetical protein
VGELGFGLRQLSPEERSRSYLSFEEFCRQSAERNETYCVTRYRRNVDEIKRSFSSVEVIWDNGYIFLLRLRGPGEKGPRGIPHGDS